MAVVIHNHDVGQSYLPIHSSRALAAILGTYHMRFFPFLHDPQRYADRAGSNVRFQYHNMCCLRTSRSQPSGQVQRLVQDQYVPQGEEGNRQGSRRDVSEGFHSTRSSNLQSDIPSLKQEQSCRLID